MNNPLVSIVVPVYNHEKYVKECLLSILNQTYKNIELTVIDDGSTDNSVLIIEELLNSYNFNFIQQENIGLSATLNKGLNRYVKGEYYCMIASDDIMMIDRVEKQLKFLQDNPNFGFCFGNLITIDSNSNDVGEIHSTNLKGQLFKDYFLSNIYIHITSCFYKSDSLKMVGGYDDNIATEDIYILRKLTRAFECGNSGGFVAKYRLHAENSSRQIWNMYLNSKKCIKEFKDEKLFKKAYKKQQLYWFFSLSKNYKIEALKHFKSAILFFPSKFFIAGVLKLLGFNFIVNKVISGKK